MNKLKLLAIGLVTALSGLAMTSANATLLLRAAYQDAALSVDGYGAVSGTGTLSADVPAGSTVLAAYIYAADVFGAGITSFTFQGNAIAPASGTLLTPNNNPANTNIYDVTSIVAPIIDGGAGGVYNFSISDAGNDGEVLVVVYSNASTVGQTAIIMDGELASSGDTTTLNFASPYVGGDLFASLAISFGFQPSGQFTSVDVTTDSTVSRRLTSCAGGQDDGESGNGALITAGGVGDSTANPDPNCSPNNGPFVDDELYNLAEGNSADAAPFINPGDTFLTLATSNPSADDNVFGLFISSTFRISNVDDTPIGDENPPTVPEPTSLALLGLGLAGLGAARRRRRT